jgi:hypothetical protein
MKRTIGDDHRERRWLQPTDLAVTSSNIGFLFLGASRVPVSPSAPSSPIPAAQRPAVSFYKGDPQSGGTLISSTTITVPAIGIQTAAAAWTVPQDNPLIYVVVDPGNLVTETDETNNTAYRAFDGAVMLPDLSVTAADISYQPACLTPLSKIMINAVFHNWGGPTATPTLRYPVRRRPENGGVNRGAFMFRSVLCPPAVMVYPSAR